MNCQKEHDELILVLDFGSQHAQLLAQRVRETQTYCEIIPCGATAEEIAKRSPIGLIFSGSPCGVHDADAPKVDPGVYKLGVPILGVCYGAQVASREFGATVAESAGGSISSSPSARC